MPDQTRLQMFQGVTIQQGSRLLLQQHPDISFSQSASGLLLPSIKTDCVFGFRHKIDSSLDFDEIKFADTCTAFTQTYEKAKSDSPLKVSACIISSSESIFENNGQDDNEPYLDIGFLGAKNNSESIVEFLKRVNILNTYYFSYSFYESFLTTNNRANRNISSGSHNTNLPIKNILPLNSYIYIFYYFRIGLWGTSFDGFGGITYRQLAFFTTSYNINFNTDVEIEV